MRALLAYLLLHANEVVSSDRLIDEVWGPEPPKTAGASLQNYVSRLRKAIGTELVVSRTPGYVLRVDPERFDLAQFERLTAEARGAPVAERAEKLRAALELWRGPALDDLAFEPFVRDEAGRLDEARLTALEQRIQADLELGAGENLVAELDELVEQHPLRERFHAERMLSLYRAGRQADALAAYQKARQVLRDELGLEPSKELRALERAILEQDESLGPKEAAVSERPADRRTVTILLCDLVDSTRLASELDPEVYRRLLSRYFELVKEAIARHGGSLEKFIGDAVMAVFGVPDLHEDDALRAVRAAVDAQTALAGETWNAPVAARIGVSTGEVHVLSGPTEDLHVSGAAASVASQLEKQAPAGGVLLSESTFRLVQDSVRAERDGDAWLILDVIAGADALRRRLDTPLVGRESELRRLHGAFAGAAEDRHCHVVTILGEAGIGKTRLIRELLGQLGNQARVLVGRCVSYGQGATYLPIAEIVRQVAPAASVAGIAAVLGGSADGEQVAQRVAELTGLAEGASAPGETFLAVRRFLESLAVTTPVVVVIDDIHWAEPTLLDLIEYLGEWGEGPMLVLCAARRELVERRPSWAGPTSSGFAIELEPLSTEHVSRLVTRLTDTAIDEQTEARIVRHAGGNPLFAEQLVAFAEEVPDLALDDPPPTIEALLAGRLDRLGQRELSALRRAAVVGRRFSLEELADLSPGEDTARDLSTLVRRALIHPAGDLYRFHHVLVRDVAYRGLPKAERADLHERAARGLARRNGADELVGFHFEQAHRYVLELGASADGASQLALEGGEHLGRAGIRAWKRADVPAAVNLLSRAMALTPEASETACELGVALRVSGESARARDVLLRARDASERHRSVRADLELAYLRSLSEPDRADELLVLARDAIPIFERASDERSVGRAWLSIAHVEGGFRCRYGVMEDAARRAARCYRRTGWSPSTALDYVGSALVNGPTPVREAIEELTRFFDEHRNDPASEANILLHLGVLEAMSGAFEVAHSHVRRASDTYRELGLMTASIDSCGRANAAIALLHGSASEAEQLLRRCCEILESEHQVAALATRAGELAESICEQGRHDDAAEWTRVARTSAGKDDLDAAITWQPIEALVLARRGDPDAGERLARRTLSLLAPTDAVNTRAKTLARLAEIVRLAGRKEESRPLLREALELYEEKGNISAADRLRSESPDRGSPKHAPRTA